MENTIGERIKHRREQLGMTQDELAAAIGYKTRSAIARIESNGRELRQKKIKDIADALKTTPSYIMGWQDEPEKTDSSDFLPTNIIPLPTMVELPLLGTIACGEPILAVENVERMVSAPQGINADFALICKGDSMINARIFDGDVVYIKSQPDVDDGTIAAVLIGEEATLKRVYKYPNKLVLRACNPIYDDLVYTDNELDGIRILGKAVAFLSAVR